MAIITKVIDVTVKCIRSGDIFWLQFFRGAETGDRSMLVKDLNFTVHPDVDFKLTGWTGTP